jgi:glyoxylase-like metal-dependent hydrolase (beta-lactamase superfamily II)
MKERVRWVLLTHTPPRPLARHGALVKATGAEVLAFTQEADRTATSSPTASIGEGDTIEGTEFGLEVLHTPGHAPDHLCFLLEEERVLFTGDTVLDGMFSVISPTAAATWPSTSRRSSGSRSCGSRASAPATATSSTSRRRASASTSRTARA